MTASKIKDKFLHGKGIFMFFRSVITSQISAYTDFIVSFIFFAIINDNPLISAMFGAIAGGIVNCIINYKFTFRMRECSYFAIGVKFFMVWLGSLLLNMFGTQGMYNLLQMSGLLESWDFSDDLIFTIARISTSLLVSVFWNFLLQRFFVFVPTKFDNFIDRVHYYIKSHRDSRHLHAGKK